MGRATFEIRLPVIALLCVLQAALSPVSGEDGRDTAGEKPASGYTGSEACAGCHTKIFETWRSTRHGYSVLTGGEAERAGYPLPVRRRGAGVPSVSSWNDVSYVIGGRQRITYADRAGRVETTSYHHRTGRWDAFPETRLADCGACHFTGFGTGDAHLDDPAMPGPWKERSIGCEACHGPGGRHVETYDKEDIVVDPSSRSCGECHTAVGRVLPEDDLHDTHDLIQNWNHDRHVTGVRFHSHNAFCSRCHSPYEGRFLESKRDAARRVFTEQKRNITCIACHDPHDLTGVHYRRESVSLSPPRPSRRQIFTGDDDDFTTTDFASFGTTEEVCVQCHRGADRIDLDHAGATCNDCHNTFNRNRSPESRAFHDANHRALSCRPCHRDADHLLSIVFGDADFLEPRSIHDLGALPGAVVARYAFRYPGLRWMAAAARGDDVGVAVEPLAPGSQSAPPDIHESERRSVRQRTRERLESVLRSRPRGQAAEDGATRRARSALTADPESIARYLELAERYVQANRHAAARALLELAASLDSTRILLDLPLNGAAARPELRPPQRGARAQAQRLLPATPDADDVETRLWLQGYLEMASGQFGDAARTFSSASSSAGDQRRSPRLEFYRGLAELGQGSHDAALATLEGVLKSEPAHLCARVALGFVQVRRRRLSEAREEFLAALATEPGDAVANYFLGRGYLHQHDAERAIGPLRAAVAADPLLLDARFALARACRLAGLSAAAAEAYREVIALVPGDFDAHFELAGLLKEASDRSGFRLRGDAEKGAPPGVRPRHWRQHLTELERRSREYGHLALSEFTTALRIRPDDRESIRQIGEILRRTGRHDEAARVFEWLADRQDGFWGYPYRVGTILLEERRYDEAISALERALALSPTQGDVYFALGLAYVRSGRITDAVRTLERGTIHEPFHPGLYTNLGAACGALGQLDRARGMLERALELGTFPLPRVHLTLTNLALVDLREGKHDAAVPRLRRALHVFPDYTRARRLLEALESSADGGRPRRLAQEPFVFNDLLEIFGEVTTVSIEND